MKIKQYLLFFLLCITCSVFGQTPELTASVSKNKLGVNQRLRVQFSINKQGGDNFKAPAFANFKIVGGPSQSVSQSWVNGKVTFNKSYTYIIQPKRKGELTIETATITFGDKKVQSKPIKITVTDAVKIPVNPNDPNYVAQQNVHLVAHISNTKPYVGEAVNVEYRLYIKNVNVNLAENYEQPKFEGFWHQRIEQKSEWKKGKFQNEDYQYAVLDKALLIPNKSGKLYVNPLEVNLLVGVATGRRDFFGNRLTQRIQRAFSSKKRLINVIPLPLENRPDTFNGAVGEYTYFVDINKPELKANESAQLKIQIKGKGNLKLFELPKIETPAELEVYQPERKEKVKARYNGLSGSIINTYTIVPEYKGKYKIPATAFSYFNPKDKKYHTIEGKDIFVNVLEGKELPTTVKSNEQITAKQTVTTTGNNFRYIQTKSDFSTIGEKPFFNSWWYYILLIVPILAIPIGIIIDKKQKEKLGDVKGNKIRNADKLAKKYLSEAQKNIDNKELFYESLEGALHNYLKAKLGVETSDISKDSITKLLEDKNVDKLAIIKFIEVLKNCDFARYTPTTDIQIQLEYQKAKEILTELDKQL